MRWDLWSGGIIVHELLWCTLSNHHLSGLCAASCVNFSDFLVLSSFEYMHSDIICFRTLYQQICQRTAACSGLHTGDRTIVVIKYPKPLETSWPLSIGLQRSDCGSMSAINKTFGGKSLGALAGGHSWLLLQLASPFSVAVGMGLRGVRVDNLCRGVWLCTKHKLHTVYFIYSLDTF